VGFPGKGVGLSMILALGMGDGGEESHGDGGYAF